MADEKDLKEASDIFHTKMKASVSSHKTPGVFRKKDNVMMISINSKEVRVVRRDGGFYTIYLNNEKVSDNFMKRNGQWFIPCDHPFTDAELNVIGFEVKKLLE